MRCSLTREDTIQWLYAYACYDTENCLTLHIIQPRMHVGFNLMRRGIYTNMQA